MARKSEWLPLRVEANTKAALVVLSQQGLGDVSDHGRKALQTYIQDSIAGLEMRIAAAEQIGGTDVEARQQLLALRAAYYSQPPTLAQ
ncbi:MAG: hypothetical protein WBV59_11875 [Anaerolineae bacterium]